MTFQCTRCGRLGFLGGNEDLFSGYFDDIDVMNYIMSVYPDELMIKNPYTADFKPVDIALRDELKSKGWTYGRDSDGDLEIICSRCNEEIKEKEKMVHVDLWDEKPGAIMRRRFYEISNMEEVRQRHYRIQQGFAYWRYSTGYTTVYDKADVKR